jgi:hypothetical protein
MDNPNYDLKKITNSILMLENEYNLLHLKINNIFVWQACRSTLYLSILDSLIPNNSGSRKSKIGYSRLKTFMSNIFFKNPFLDFKKSDVLIFKSGRYYLVEGEGYIDIYTKYFCEDLKNFKVKYQEYESSNLYSEYKIKNDAAKHLDFISLLSLIKSKFIRVKFTTIDEENIDKIEIELKNLFGVSLNVRHVFEQEIIKFKSQYSIYKLLFKLKRASKIYLVSSVDKSALIKAAKDSDILVNELQHGLISNEGLISNYPDTKEDSLEYFPNKFYVWDNLNMYTSKLPLSRNNIIKFPNKHLEYLVNKNRERARDYKQILVVSQPYNSKDILNYISGNLARLVEWKIIYKLHPVENQIDFMHMINPLLVKFKNLTVVNNELSIYDLLSESAFVVGVYSTSVFEAPLFGCKVLLLNLPGIEASKPLIASGDAVLLNVNENLINFLE